MEDDCGIRPTSIRRTEPNILERWRQHETQHESPNKREERSRSRQHHETIHSRHCPISSLSLSLSLCVCLTLFTTTNTTSNNNKNSNISTMDSNPSTETASDKTATPTTSTMADIVDLTVHPLVLLSVADHYHRVARGTRKRVVGVLLGTVFGGKVDATNSFAVPFEEDSKNPVE